MGRHDKQQAKSDLGVNYSGLALEFVDDFSTPKKAQDVLKYLTNKNDQYQQVIEEAKKSGKPVFLLDMKEMTSFDPFLMISELVGGGILLANIISKIKKTDKINRREVLKMFGKAFLSSYLLMPGVIGAVYGSSGVSPKDKNKVDLYKEYHPEIMAFTLRMRNLLIAQKLYTIKRKFPDIRIGELVMIAGSFHRHIPEILLMPEAERLKDIKEMWHFYPGLDPKVLTSIAKLDFDGKDWKADVFEDEKLLDALGKSA